MLPELRTARCLLRQLSIDDAPAYLEMRRNPADAALIPRQPTTTLEEMERIARRVLSQLDAGTTMPWTIVRGGVAIGLVGLTQIDTDNALAHVAYELSAAHRGAGIMSEALARVVEYAFHDALLHRLEAHIDPRNRASIRVAERAGFVREGVLRENHRFMDRFYDTAIYGRCADA